MPNRYLKDSICTSDNFNLLSLAQRGFWLHLITSTDDFGRADARPEIIKGSCFPLLEITPAEINNHLEAIEKACLLMLYTVDGRRYLQFQNWEKHNRLRAKKSRFPAMIPPVNLFQSDSVCQQIPADGNRREHLRPEVEVEVEVEEKRSRKEERDSKESLPVSAKKPRKPTAQKSVDPLKAAERQLFLNWFCYAFRESQGDRYRVEGAKDGNILKALLSRVPVKELVAKACGMFTDINFPKSKRPSLGMLSAKLNDYPVHVNGRLDDFRQRGLLPPEGIMLEDWTPWKEQADETLSC